MARVKQFKTIDEQIDILKDKGLIISDYEKTKITDFMEFTAENNCVPEIMIYHELAYITKGGKNRTYFSFDARQ